LNTYSLCYFLSAQGNDFELAKIRGRPKDMLNSKENVINGELKARQVRSRSEKNRMKVLHMLLLPLIVLPLTSSNPPVAQTCAEIAYENRNQVDYGPLQLGGVRGIVHDFQGVDIPKACVGIFTDVGHNLVEMSETDDRGQGIPARCEVSWVMPGKRSRTDLRWKR